MLWTALAELGRSDAVYVWGLFVWVLPALVVAGRILKKPIVVSTRGMLAPQALGRKSVRKRAFLALLRLSGLERVARLHATSQMESEDVTRELPKASVVVIPNGVEIPEERTLATLQASGSNQAPYFLFLGRLDPHKQVERVVKAFGEVVGGKGGGLWRLVIAGEGERRYETELRDLVGRLALSQHVEFSGYVEGPQKESLLIRSACLVLASKSENFGMSVAEALAAGVPVIASRGTPWPELAKRCCGWWVEDSVESLGGAMCAAMALSIAQRREMGRQGREWMRADFGWPSIAKRLRAEMAAPAGVSV